MADVTAGAQDSGVAEQVLSNIELMCIVLGYLKNLTLNESNLIVDGYTLDLSTSWTGPFARLALVNRAFCTASTDVLWQNMASIEPFFRVLLHSDPQKAEEVQTHSPLCPLSGAPTAEAWSRFRFYSSKTVRLSPTLSSSTTIDPSWFTYLAMSTEPLFPRLEHLYLTKSNPLVEFITLSVAPIIQSISLHPGVDFNEESMANLATALSQNAMNLTALKISPHLPTNPTLTIMSKISWLRELTLQLSGKDNDVDFGFLSNLSSLEVLSIEQLDAAPPLSPDAPDTGELLIRPSNLPSLRKLTVVAGSWMHWKVTSTLSPSNLRDLTLQVKPHEYDVNMIFAPLAAAVHLRRNQSLVNFDFFCNVFYYLRPEVDQILGGDTSYNDVTPLLNSISRLRRLERLIIGKIPFSQADSTSLLLDAAMGLPSLLSLWLHPLGIPDVDYDSRTLPSLRKLSEVRKRLPGIRILSFPMNIEDDIPPIPDPDSLPAHPLRSLGNPHLTLYIISSYAAATEKKRDLVEYLLHLFPALRDFAEEQLFKSGTRSREFWKSIRDVLEATRQALFQSMRIPIREGLVVDSPSRILDAVENLPSLEMLCVGPRCLEGIGPNSLPSLQRVSELCKQRLPRVTTLMIPMNLDDIPQSSDDENAGCISNHPLRRGLGFTTLTQGTFAEYTATKQTALVDYLLPEFPHLKDVATTAIWEIGTTGREFSASIDQLVKFARRSQERGEAMGRRLSERGQGP